MEVFYVLVSLRAFTDPYRFADRIFPLRERILRDRKEATEARVLLKQ
jgi:hypothetical protein